jgi:hypothetical protein
MKKLWIVVFVVALVGCAELQVASDVLDIIVPDPIIDPCAPEVKAAVEKATVDGVTVYRISLPGEATVYEYDELSALSEAAAMNTDRYFKCRDRKHKDELMNRRKAKENILNGNVNPQWDMVK